MITYTEYAKLGYSTIPKDEFSRYEAKAALTAHKYTFGRLNRTKLTESNRRGICELADLYYSEDNNLNRKVSGFTTNKYSETWAVRGGDSLPSAEQSAYALMQIYFAAELLYRGV